MRRVIIMGAMDVPIHGSGQLMSVITALTMFTVNAATLGMYVLDRGILRPQRVFFYFGAVQAIEAYIA